MLGKQVAVDFEEQFARRIPKSEALYKRALEVLPSGASGSAKLLGNHVLYATDAHGSRIVDVDGNEYVDYSMGGGPAILGHSPPAVINAVAQQLERGTSLCNNEVEATLRLAEEIRRNMPWMEYLRFLTTGQEATMTAIRAARAFTGRDKVAKVFGGYHGGHDYALESCANFGLPDSAGIPQVVQNLVLTIPYNDTEGAATTIKKNAKDLAAVIMEPVPIFYGHVIQPEREYVKVLREVTEQNDILLIFDEIVTGFRLGLGGGAGYLGVTPDLSTLGKIVGGGFPSSVYGGRQEIMKAVFAAGSPKAIFQSGTYTANPIAVTAGLATIKELERPGVYDQLEETGERLRKGLKTIAADLELQIQVLGLKSIFHTLFMPTKPYSRKDAMTSNIGMLTGFHFGLLANGVFIKPTHPGFVSTAHTKREIDQTLDISRSVLSALKTK
jgi:glutamate-1-semialdehyde 2,1-aminomutase